MGGEVGQGAPRLIRGICVLERTGRKGTRRTQRETETQRFFSSASICPHLRNPRSYFGANRCVSVDFSAQSAKSVVFFPPPSFDCNAYGVSAQDGFAIPSFAICNSPICAIRVLFFGALCDAKSIYAGKRLNLRLARCIMFKSAVCMLVATGS